MRRRFCLLLVCLFAGVGCGSGERGPALPEGVLRVAIPTEPQTWNRLLASGLVTHVVTDQLHEPLIRLNPRTQEMEPALAESWEIVEDDSGARIVFHLRAGLRFSDGEPFTAEDVAFTFRVLHDESTASQLTETVQLDGEPFVPEVLDAATVALRLPRLTATVERVFDSIRILPEHRLRASLDRGTLAADSGLGAPPENVVGLGPFGLREHVPGQRIVLERNPFYWRTGGGDDVFPRLSSIVFEVVPDGSARLLRLRSGDIDLLDPLAPDAFRALNDAESTALRLIDAGPGMLSERLWFNLNPASPIEEHKKRWFTNVRFRRAVSLSIDRVGMARVVYSGLATPAAGPVSPANTFWKNAAISPAERAVDRARELLAEAGFRWDEDGHLVDSAGTPVCFDIITNAGRDHYRSVGAFIKEDLSALGIQAHTRPVDGSSLLARLTGSFDYDAALLGIGQTDPDPSAGMAFWMSKEPLHLWHPSQSEPATEWEARIDELMMKQMRSLDPEHRKACFDEVQSIVAEQLPVIDLVVPHALLGAHERVLNLKPSPFTHALWNSYELSAGLGEN